MLELFLPDCQNMNHTGFPYRSIEVLPKEQRSVREFVSVFCCAMGFESLTFWLPVQCFAVPANWISKKINKTP